MSNALNIWDLVLYIDHHLINFNYLESSLYYFSTGTGDQTQDCTLARLTLKHISFLTSTLSLLSVLPPSFPPLSSSSLSLPVM